MLQKIDFTRQLQIRSIGFANRECWVSKMCTGALFRENQFEVQ